MRRLNVPEQLSWPDDKPNASFSSVKELAQRYDGEGTGCDDGVEGRNTEEGTAVSEVLVDFISNQDEVVKDTKLVDEAKFLSRKDFAKRVMTGSGKDVSETMVDECIWEGTGRTGYWGPARII